MAVSVAANIGTGMTEPGLALVLGNGGMAVDSDKL